MENEYMKRGYLLPEGCKDLFDALKLKQKPAPCAFLKLPYANPAAPKPWTKVIPLPPIRGELILPAQVTVSQLAALLQKRPFVLIADLMQLGIFATVSQMLDFDTIAKVARKHGFVAKRAD
jgi:hypothetical protein